MDNAEKVRSKIRKAAYRPLTLDERSWSLAALAALEKQAADAQQSSEMNLAAFKDELARARDMEARAVRAEEALRHLRDAVARADAKPRGGTYVMPSPDWIRIADYRNFAALAAAGADTP